MGLIVGVGKEGGGTGGGMRVGCRSQQAGGG